MINVSANVSPPSEAVRIIKTMLTTHFPALQQKCPGLGYRFGGLAPVIFETSRQARFMIPMAISLGYGILFATLITLILVPSLYMVSEDVFRIRQWVYPSREDK